MSPFAMYPAFPDPGFYEDPVAIGLAPRKRPRILRSLHVRVWLRRAKLRLKVSAFGSWGKNGERPLATRISHSPQATYAINQIIQHHPRPMSPAFTSRSRAQSSANPVAAPRRPWRSPDASGSRRSGSTKTSKRSPWRRSIWGRAGTAGRILPRCPLVGVAADLA
jgi:hypothetical protein